MEFVDYARILRKRWRVLVATTLIGLLLALAFGLFSTKMYSAQSKVYVHLATVSQSSAYPANQYVLSLMASYLELNGSPVVLEPVITKLGLHESVQTLAGRVTITNPAGTTYLDVDAKADSFAEAKRVARATSRELATVIGGLQVSTTADRVVVARSQPATGDAAAVSPRVPLDLALGLVAGLIIGAIWVLVRNSVDGTVRDIDELHRLTGTAPLARIRADGPAMVSAVGSQLDEYRGLRTGLAIASGGHLPGSVVVVAVGCEDGPGVAASLAQVAAGSGVRTCLVQADLGRRIAAGDPKPGRQHSAAEPADRTEAAAPGLSDVLQGRVELSDVVLSRPDSGVPLAVLGRGVPSDDPADLLDSPAMQRVHRILRASFELVVYASTPAPEHPDAVILSRDVAASMLVVRAGRSARSDLAEVGERLATVGASVSGVVIVEQTGRSRARRGRGRRDVDVETSTDAPSVPVPLSEPGTTRTPFDPPREPSEHPVSPGIARSSRSPLHLEGAVSVLPPRARSSRSRRASVPFLDDDTVEDDTVEDDTVEDDTVEDDTVEGDTVEGDTIEDGDAVSDHVLSQRVSVIDTLSGTSRSRTGQS